MYRIPSDNMFLYQAVYIQWKDGRRKVARLLERFDSFSQELAELLQVRDLVGMMMVWVYLQLLRQ